LSEGTAENHENPQSGELVSRSRCESHLRGKFREILIDYSAVKKLKLNSVALVHEGTILTK
jgi:hypothetical protein